MSGDIDSGAVSGARGVGQATGAPGAAVTAALVALVTTLSLARARAAERSDADLGALLQRARAQLDVADEHLLALDRNRQRSSFRQAARIRHRLEAIEVQVIALSAPVPSSGERPDSAAA